MGKSYFDVGFPAGVLRLHPAGDGVDAHGAPEVGTGFVEACHAYGAPFEG